ncbi:peptidase M48 [Litchfieldella qijiaojingensis]|uniref:Peptidase M48 n=1 Tax=Litchfieldella qijiaojingensis TaxID=980347 RepID=A0ABQ2YP73_9GAMM|nr:zinc metalloprotease HtpX [Halomonas qijiaojingensis]GGX89345.1 peptidase M48 [Halomonas qijiaojingensis]
MITLRPQRLWLVRLKNGFQALLIMAGLALVLSVPGYLLAGTGGVIMSFVAVAIAAHFSSWVPARIILANAGAGLLRRHHAPELYGVLDILYQRAGLEIEPQLYYSPSRDLNAFAVGDRRDGGIAITAGLLRTLDLRQLAAVLAHEVNHLQHGDTRVMSMAAAMTRLTFWLATVVQISLLLLLPLIMTGEGELPWLPLLLVALSPTLSTLLQLALSRNREYTADLEAAAITGDPYGLASALDVLERHNGSWLTTLFGRQPPAWIQWLHTHPPTHKRIRRLHDIGGLPRHSDSRPSIRLPEVDRPLIIQRPGPAGGRYWILRRR